VLMHFRTNFDVVWVDRPTTKSLDFCPIPSLCFYTDISY
jgi:hypothetical protein